MGLISNTNIDRRPRDWAYRVTFDRKDLPSLEEMGRRIRETHDTDMIEDFNLKCEQKLTGQTAVLDNGLEIKSVTKSDDLVVNTGLRHCINIILGLTSVRWSHFGISQGNPPAPAITDTVLQIDTSSFRVPLLWAEAIGMKIFFGGISSQTDASISGVVAPFAPNAVGEIGVYNSGVAGAVLLNRSQFLSDVLAQNSPTISETRSAPIIVSCVIEFCPVV